MGCRGFLKKKKKNTIWTKYCSTYTTVSRTTRNVGSDTHLHISMIYFWQSTTISPSISPVLYSSEVLLHLYTVHWFLRCFFTFDFLFQTNFFTGQILNIPTLLGVSSSSRHTYSAYLWFTVRQLLFWTWPLWPALSSQTEGKRLVPGPLRMEGSGGCSL